MPTALLTAATETPEKLPLPPLAFALLALGGFAVLFAITWAFRSVGKKH